MLMEDQAAALPTKPSDGSLPFEVKLAFIAAIVLFFPFSLCLLLTRKVSVQYWVGHSLLYVCTALTIWVLLCYFALLTRQVRRRLAPVGMIIVPAAVLTVACQLQAWKFSGIGVALQSQDCQTFPEKARLESAWDAADQVWRECTQKLAEVTGSTLEETRAVANFQACSDYPRTEKAHHREWQYLAYVEYKHRCAGWCTAAEPVFNRLDWAKDSCSKAVAQAISSHANLGYQVTVYSIVLLVLTSLVVIFQPQWLIEL